MDGLVDESADMQPAAAAAAAERRRERRTADQG
jgi:hypothetical protein